MKINSINFGNRTIITRNNNIQSKREYSDNGVLLSNSEIDENSGKYLKVEHFDNNGNPLDVQKFTYAPNKTTEYYKSKTQEYTRVITKENKDSFEHRKIVYTSKTSPDSNYIQETIRNIKGKLVAFIVNGKKLTF